MFKKIAMMMLVGGVGMMVLAGCSLKSSRQFIEGKAAELSKVYPTENLEDLFDKFPDGFGIFSDDIYDYKEGEGYFYQSIELKGDAENKVVRGIFKEKKVSIDKNKKRKEDVLYEGGVVYKDGMIQLMDPQANVTIKNPKLLLQEFTINRNTLSKLKMGGKGYSVETGSADIDYILTDPILNTYMGVEQDKELKMVIYIMSGTVENKTYSYTLEIQDGQNTHAEIISGG
ncbi:hypothetical protein SORDD21_01217 [Streptococcus oralis]|jgi:hypothetical protein|uniref:Lipoprotein n=1 Tax=Streptococcus oralis TaxID=1303 RepID=A0A139PJL7_STROR|nr:hypothetical protein [Streptococcus oralis]KXT90527.1 hypothetical protein SORDD21_01217 [Streptococcus oralis]RXX21719.1 hypothetical protein DF216_04715 [Streptococcus oralis]